MPSSCIPRKILSYSKWQKKRKSTSRPQVRFSRETVSAARVTSGHCSTLWVREQNLGECTRIPHARNSRGITQDSKRRGKKRVQGTTTLACQCGQRRRHGCGTHPSPQGFSQPIPLEFLDSFRFPSLPFVAASLHRSALSILFRGTLRSARALESANLSRLVSSSAILCSGACIHAGGSSSLQHSSHLSQNRRSHQRPQSLPKSKPRPPKWARDTFFRHSGSSPLLSTRRHVEVSAVDVFVVLIGFFFKPAKQFTRQASSLGRRVAPVRGDCCVRALSTLGGLRNISLATRDFKANESLVNVLRSSRSIITPPTSELFLWSRNELIRTLGRWDVGTLDVLPLDWTLDVEGLKWHVERWDIRRWNAERWTSVAGRYYGGPWSSLYDRHVDDDGHPQGKIAT